MQMHSIKIRWLTAVCYEIILPNGKVILTDPYITPNKIPMNCPIVDNKGFANFDLDEIKQVDYILCTHTHIDHDADIGALIKRFPRCQVFVGQRSAMDLFKYHDLSFDNVFPVYPNQNIELEDFTLFAYPFRHNHFFETCSQTPNLTKETFGWNGHQDLDLNGSIECLDYLITCNNGMRILLAGGVPLDRHIFSLCRDWCPDVLIRQFNIRRPSDGAVMTPAEQAQVFTAYHAQLILPSHHEGLICKQGEDFPAYVDNIRAEMAKLDPGVSLLIPEQFNWYQIGVCAQKV